MDLVSTLIIVYVACLANSLLAERKARAMIVRQQAEIEELNRQIRNAIDMLKDSGRDYADLVCRLQAYQAGPGRN